MTQIENGMIVGAERYEPQVRMSKCSGAQSAARCGRRGI